tara:strand:- start:1097 stop:2656 length:1560 start_codon:yes stop_codon:yes gene_type:complete
MEEVVEKTEEILEKRKEKVKEWLKDPYNLILVGILVFAFLIRIYFFFLTKNQALWWDEAEYMLKAKTIFRGTPTTGLAAIREAFIPYIWSVFYWFANGEVLIRFFQVIVSTFTVFMTFIVGRQLLNKRIGLFAAFFMSISPIQIFFTNRVLTYLWSPMVYLLAIYFFVKGYRSEKNKYLYISMIFLALGMISYFNVFFLTIVIFLFLLYMKGFKLFKQKRWWKSLLVFVVVISPFIIYYLSTIGLPLPRFKQFQVVGQRSLDGSYLPFIEWFNYFDQIPRILGNPAFFGMPVFLFFLIGCLSLIEIILAYDLIKKSRSLENKFFLWLWVLVPILMLTLIEIVQNSMVFYDAFLIPLYPAFAIVSGIGFNYIFRFLKKYSKTILKLVIFALIILSILSTVPYASSLIKAKVNSYDTLKDAGFWIKENSNPEDKILTQAMPEITYYSERETVDPPVLEEDLAELIREHRFKFFVVSAWEAAASPQWFLDYGQRNQDKVIPIAAFPQNQPTTVVFFINQSAF